MTRELWAMLEEGVDPEGRGCPQGEREAQRASPVPSSFTHAQPLCLVLSRKNEIQDTLREERKDGEDVLRPLPSSIPEPGSPPHDGGGGRE